MKPFDPFSSANQNQTPAPFSPFAPNEAVEQPAPYSPFPVSSEPSAQKEPTIQATPVILGAAPYSPQIADNTPVQPAVEAYKPEIVSADRVQQSKPSTVDKAFSAFETSEMSFKEKARHVVLSVFGKDCVHEAWFDFLLSWTSAAYKDGEAAVRKWLTEVGDRNQKMHDKVTDLHRDYDMLNVVDSIANAHKMMSDAAEKKWFKRSTIDSEKLEAHLAVIRQAVPPMQSRLEKMLQESRIMMQETQAVNDLTLRNRAEFDIRGLQVSAERIYLLNQSVAILVPNLLLLEREFNQQVEDIETLVTITLPIWRRTQRR